MYQSYSTIDYHREGKKHASNVASKAYRYYKLQVIRWVLRKRVKDTSLCNQVKTWPPIIEFQTTKGANLVLVHM